MTLNTGNFSSQPSTPVRALRIKPVTISLAASLCSSLKRNIPPPRSLEFDCTISIAGIMWVQSTLSLSHTDLLICTVCQPINLLQGKDKGEIHHYIFRCGLFFLDRNLWKKDICCGPIKTMFNHAKKICTVFTKQII